MVEQANPLVVVVGGSGTILGPVVGAAIVVLLPEFLADMAEYRLLLFGALLLLGTIGLALGGPTGYAINPARDLGPRIAHALLPIPGKGGFDWGYAWVPVAGPVFGGIYGAVFYSAVFTGDYNVLFWVLSAVMAVILFGAASAELKKGHTVANEIEDTLTDDKGRQNNRVAEKSI